LENEHVWQIPNGEPVTQLGLAITISITLQLPFQLPCNYHLFPCLTISRLNSGLRRDGVSAYELWTQRNTFTQEQLPLEGRNIITK
jgi:hypothetical protein